MTLSLQIGWWIIPLLLTAVIIVSRIYYYAQNNSSSYAFVYHAAMGFFLTSVTWLVYFIVITILYGNFK